MAGGFPGGGSLTLSRYLDEHGAAIYADLLRFYGVDVVGLVSDPPTVSPAQVLALISGLPAESKTVSLLREADEAVGWATTSYLLASVVDAVRENTHVVAQVNSKKKLKPPEPLKVPGVRARRPEKRAPNAFVRMAQKQFEQSRK